MGVREQAAAAAPDREAFLHDVLDGLSQPQKSVPAKYLYDVRGSELFEEICALEEYYPTRTEIALLRAHGGEIAGLAGPDATVVEFGSGASVKTRILLDALEAPRACVPIDISGDYLRGIAEELSEAYPGLDVLPLSADFTGPLTLPAEAAPPRLGFFPGSTIGNFRIAEAGALLRRFRDALDGGALLIGVDLDKDPAVLHAAYNDRAGVTAAFNLNLLRRINRELVGSFDLRAFRHEARYVVAERRIEMHLVSRRTQTVKVDAHAFSFAEGESIHTEDSHKYTPEGFAALAAGAGWAGRRRWVDPRGWFSLHYLEPA